MNKERSKRFIIGRGGSGGVCDWEVSELGKVEG